MKCSEKRRWNEDELDKSQDILSNSEGHRTMLVGNNEETLLSKFTKSSAK